MELNFFYAHNGKYGKIVLNAEELDYTVNYSQFNRYRPSSSDTSNYGWLPIETGGLKQTLPRFYGTLNTKATYSTAPGRFTQEFISMVTKFDGTNTYALDRYANFIDTDDPNNYTGIDLYVQGDEGKKKVCKLQWAVLEEDDPQHPGQKILTSYFNGLYAFLCPNDDGELPTGSVVGNLRNLQAQQGKYSANAKIALWIITVHDDISGSPTYGQDFKVLVEAFSHPTGFSTQGIIMADMRCLTGVENSANIINGSDPKKNSTPTGWAGTRNVWSSADTPTVAPTALKKSVNYGEHGIFLYKMDSSDMNDMSSFLWSKGLVTLFKDYIYSPTSGILGVFRLPYIPDNDPDFGGKTDVKLCGTTATYTKEKYKLIKDMTSIATFGLSQLAFNENVQGRLITGAQEALFDPIEIPEFFGSFLDYEPFTKISVRLPFIGVVPVPTSCCMGGTLQVNYILDNRNGNVVAQILAKGKRNMEDERSDKWEIVAQYSGNCQLPMALTGNSQGSSDVMGAIKGFASNSAGTLLMTDRGSDASTKAAEVAGMTNNAVNLGLDLIFAQHEPRMFGTLNSGVGPMTDLTCRVMITRPWDVTPGITRNEDGKRVFDASELLTQKGIAGFSGGVVNQYEGMTAGYILGNIPGATYEEMNKIRQLFQKGVVIHKVQGGS